MTRAVDAPEFADEDFGYDAASLRHAGAARRSPSRALRPPPGRSAPLTGVALRLLIPDQTAGKYLATYCARG